MAANEPLATVQDYVTEARVLLLDEVRPYRYDDDSILAAINLCLLEARRLRADLFVTRWGSNVPFYTTVSGVRVEVEAQFRLGILYGIVAHAMSRDEEDVQDARVNAFYGRFHDVLVGGRQRNFPAGTGGIQQGRQNAAQAKAEGSE